MGGGAPKESWRSGDIPPIREVAESKTQGRGESVEGTHTVSLLIASISSEESEEIN